MYRRVYADTYSLRSQPLAILATHVPSPPAGRSGVPLPTPLAPCRTHPPLDRIDPGLVAPALPGHLNLRVLAVGDAPCRRGAALFR